MLRRIILESFMSHAHTVIDLADGLTVLTGPNNCGKSAVVAALRILDSCSKLAVPPEMEPAAKILDLRDQLVGAVQRHADRVYRLTPDRGDGIGIERVEDEAADRKFGSSL